MNIKAIDLQENFLSAFHISTIHVYISTTITDNNCGGGGGGGVCDVLF